MFKNTGIKNKEEKRRENRDGFIEISALKAVKLFWLFPAASENPGGQGDDSFQQLEDSIDRYPDQPEGKEKKPDYRVQKQGKKGERPTENQ